MFGWSNGKWGSGKGKKKRELEYQKTEIVWISGKILEMSEFCLDICDSFDRSEKVR